MTPETSRMIGQLSGNPIPFLFPIILTAILIRRHPISFKSISLVKILAIISIWSIAIVIKEQLFNAEELSYIFFLYYAIIIAYIHVQIYGKRLFIYYEDILVKICFISFIIWLIAVAIPGTASIFRLFPETSYGNNILYLFCWMDPTKGQVSSGIIRNAGCSWEPGRFAIMILLAIFLNLSRKGINFKQNKNIYILLATILSTQSTTGYSIVLILYCIFLLKSFSLSNIILIIFILIPIIYGTLSLGFMGSKIKAQLDIKSDIERLQTSFDYNAQIRNKGEYRGSLGRFQAIYFEWINICHDPLLGYSRNSEHSFFYKKISTNYTLTGGLLKLIGQFGLVVGIFLYYCLFKSSILIAKDNKYKRKYALAALLICSSISYTIFTIPIFTAFWFYGSFKTRH